MKATFEEAVDFTQALDAWMKARMKELLPPHLFALVEHRRRGCMRKLNKWLKENHVEIQSSPFGVRIFKNGIKYSEIQSVIEPPNVANN